MEVGVSGILQLPGEIRQCVVARLQTDADSVLVFLPEDIWEVSDAQLRQVLRREYATLMKQGSIVVWIGGRLNPDDDKVTIVSLSESGRALLELPLDEVRQFLLIPIGEEPETVE
jgi:hypothetical protein